jgi:hypothetical protein
MAGVNDIILASDDIIHLLVIFLCLLFITH